ncbi:MAG: PIN domain nuclease [Pseudomonadales bacterium]|nr:PIN domain nuclease [Pseudomonadales bacterium]
MILVDSSVWIDFFNGRKSKETDYLDSLLGVEQIVIGDLILMEVLQGFRLDADYEQAKNLLLNFTVHEMFGISRALRAAECYRTLRKKGVTVRRSNDMIIGAYCIDASIPLLFSDRDFSFMTEHLGLVQALPN